MRIHMTLLSFALVACSGSDAPLFSKSVTYRTSTNGGYLALAVSGNYIYGGADQIYVYELSGDTDLTEIGTLAFGNNIKALAVRGNALYYDWGTGTQIADISIPGVITPVKPLADFDALAFAQLNASTTQRFVGSTAVDSEGHIIVWDLLDPLDPIHAGDIYAAPTSTIAVDGNLLYAGSGSAGSGSAGFGGAHVYDITNLAAPQLVGSAVGTASPDRLFAIGDGLIYCGHGMQGIRGPTLLDARDPTQPTFLNLDSWGSVDLFARTGDLLFTVTERGYAGGQGAVFDISVPLEPRILAFGTMDRDETGYVEDDPNLIYGAGVGEDAYTIIADARHVYSAHPDGLTITTIFPR